MEHDLYFKKMVELRHVGITLRFQVAQELFSSHQVDRGTRFLLRTLADIPRGLKVLDLGCGYGPIGLALRANGAGEVHLVDRDALAVAYTRQNAALNRLEGVEVYGSLGYDDVRARDFDLIAANLPGKAGPPVLAALLNDARYYLAAGGWAAVVVVAPLAATVETALREAGASILHREVRGEHVVFHYDFPRLRGRPSVPLPAFERGTYDRAALTVTFGEQRGPMWTVYGLPDFDTPSYADELLLTALYAQRSPVPRQVLLFNPGQGYVAIAIWRWLSPRRIALVSRDLLSLRAARRNLTLNGCPAERVHLHHRAAGESWDVAPADLIAASLPPKVRPEIAAVALGQMTARLTPGGRLFLTADSTTVTRLVRYLRRGKTMHLLQRRRRKGYSLLVARRGDEAQGFRATKKR